MRVVKIWLNGEPNFFIFINYLHSDFNFKKERERDKRLRIFKQIHNDVEQLPAWLSINIFQETVVTIAPVFGSFMFVENNPNDDIRDDCREQIFKRMRFENVRFATYKHFPPRTPFAVRFAQAGLYYKGNGDEVMCYVCQKSFRNWTEDDSPLHIHREFSPFCPYFTDNSSVNIEITRTPNDLFENSFAFDYEHLPSPNLVQTLPRPAIPTQIVRYTGPTAGNDVESREPSTISESMSHNGGTGMFQLIYIFLLNAFSSNRHTFTNHNFRGRISQK